MAKYIILALLILLLVAIISCVALGIALNICSNELFQYKSKNNELSISISKYKNMEAEKDVQLKEYEERISKLKSIPRNGDYVKNMYKALKEAGL